LLLEEARRSTTIGLNPPLGQLESATKLTNEIATQLNTNSKAVLSLATQLTEATGDDVDPIVTPLLGQLGNAGGLDLRSLLGRVTNTLGGLTHGLGLGELLGR